MPTMFDKIWQNHEVLTEEGGNTLLYVDRCLVHEGSRQVFEKLEREQRGITNPRQIVACCDHYVPTVSREGGIKGITQSEIRHMIELMEGNARKNGIPLFGMEDPRQGILHLICPEQAITQPGMVIAGADSHTSTHGAFGNFAFGVGFSEAALVMATQTIWQRKPQTLRIKVQGEMGMGVTPKDLILYIINQIGVDGARGCCIEYAGPVVESLSMEGRMTVCNMSIEAGGRAGMVAPDEKTFAYLQGRPYAPTGKQWELALEYWKTLPSDPDAIFDREVKIDASKIQPMVTWGTNQEQSAFINETAPQLDSFSSPAQSEEAAAALAYMGLEPGQPMEGIPVDQVFIGSCTNGKLEDLRDAAKIAALGKAQVPVMVVPGSQEVKRKAESEGLDAIFQQAGFEWRHPGCSMCTALNGDQLQPRQRCASTTNRNFRGRQGPESRTHLMSPPMAAACALTGKITDFRKLLPGA